MTTYHVETSDRAAAEREAAFLRMVRLSPETAGRWLSGLLDAVASLAEFPGPRSHSIAQENDRFDVEVRRLLYYGPGGRRGGSVYRVLFHVIEPAEGETQGVVRVLRILHAAQVLEPADLSEREEEEP